MTESNQAPTERPAEVVDQRGPWPFVTRRVFRAADQSERVWSSRHDRKGLFVRAAEKGSGPFSRNGPEGASQKRVLTPFQRPILWRCLWMPRQLNWWIGIIFALGSLLFAVASLLSLMPQLAKAWSLDSTQINAIFFAGSIPFTTAAYLQLFQAANAGDVEKGSDTKSAKHPKGRSGFWCLTPFRRSFFGWRPHDIGWLSCALQFVGTILFNFNTFDAMLPSLNWFQQDLVIWAPNIVGSILFLASGYLAFIETCHAYWAWNPSSISWWVVFTNLLGCVGFLISALLAIILPGTPNIEVVHMSIFFTLFGAFGFLVGSLLMLPETVSSEPQ